jgi:transcriptional regulator with PAS, ATPase and Fis domain
MLSRRALSFSNDEEVLSMEKMEKKHALRVLERVGGNRLRAAQVLGISRATLYRLLGNRTKRSPASLELTADSQMRS